MVTDGFGSSEAGTQGAMRVAAGEGDAAPVAGRWCASTSRRSRRSWSTRRPAAPRWRRGRAWSARCSPAGGCRSATTTIPTRPPPPSSSVDGERWLVTGDMATVGADGAIELLGRGSVSINTGGEKVLPRRGRGRPQGPPRRVRLPGRGRARRPVGQRGHRRRPAGRRAPSRPSTSWRPTARRRSPATRRRSTSSSSTPSCARRPARPTTAGPRRPPRSSPPRPAEPRGRATTLRACGCATGGNDDADDVGAGRGAARGAAGGRRLRLGCSTGAMRRARAPCTRRCSASTTSASLEPALVGHGRRPGGAGAGA